MAKKTIALEIDINADDGAKSLKELKQEFKDLNASISGLKEGSEEYYQTLKKIADTKDQMDDLNEAIAAQTGAGKFQALANVGSQIAAGFSLAQGAMALFGNESKEVEQALLRVQSAQAILQGFKELEGVGDALKNAKDAITSMGQGIANYIKGLEGATVAQKLFNLIASLNPVGLIVTAVAALAAGLVILAKNYQTVSDENKELRAEMEKSNAVIGDQIRANESLIRMLEGVYGQEKKLAALKKENLELQKQQVRASFEQAAREYADAQTKIKAFEQQYGVLDKLTGSLNIVKQKLQQQLADSGREMTRLAEQNKSLVEQTINNQLREKGEAQKAEDEKRKAKVEAQKKEKEDFTMHHIELTQIAVENNQELMKKTIDMDVLMEEKRKEIDEYYKQKKRERDERNKAFAISATQEGLQVIQDLTTAFAGKSEEAQRRAFNINKAAQIAEATISSILAAQKAFTSQLVSGDPTSPIRATIAAALAAAAGVARIAAIARTQFDGGGQVQGGGGLTGGFSGNGATFTPNLNNSLGNTSTVLSNLNNQNNGGQQPPTKVYVTETDISGAIEKMNKIKTKALIE